MVEDYEQQHTKAGGTTMGHEGNGTAIHDMEDLMNGELITEAVTEYSKRATLLKKT